MSEPQLPKSPYSVGYRNFVLLMLTIVYIFNFVDRQILVILQESIKSDLNLNDTQLGLLSGFTFAIFYVTMGVPIARWADRSNRRNIVSLSLIIWSSMTALSSVVQNYGQLLLARIGVGVGEAGGSPPAHAMISDYFPPNRRATALAVYSAGIYMGILIGYTLGGFLDENYGWRAAFLYLGIPGVIYALLFWLLVQEPQRGAYDQVQLSDKKSFSTGEVLKVLLGKRSFILLALATGLHAFGQYGIGNWLPPFLSRVHGMESGEIGTALGLILGVGGGIGTIFGGIVADRLGKKDKRWYLRVPSLFIILGLPFAIAFLAWDQAAGALTFILIVNILNTSYLGPSIAVTHGLVPPEMRAFSSAILFFVLNLIGLGLGPLTVGFLSDMLTPQFGNESLRYALIAPVIGSLVATLLFWRASLNLREEMA